MMAYNRQQLVSYLRLLAMPMTIVRRGGGSTVVLHLDLGSRNASKRGAVAHHIDREKGTSRVGIVNSPDARGEVIRLLENRSFDLSRAATRTKIRHVGNGRASLVCYEVG
jgi:hypothetical protein